MKILIENFGPIRDFELKLNKLMIFVGRNNSGKSYSSLLLEIINTTFMDLREALREIIGEKEFPYYMMRKYFDKYLLRTIKREKSKRIKPKTFFDYETFIKTLNKTNIDKLIGDLGEKFKTLKAPFRSRVPIPEDIKKKTFNYLIAKISENLKLIFFKKLSNKFSTEKISELINFNANYSKIIIKSNSVKIELLLRTNEQIDISFNLFNIEEIFNKMRKPLRDIEGEIRSYFSTNTNINRKDEIREAIIYSTIKSINVEIIELIDLFIVEKFTDTLYLPATRSGLIQAYDTIATAYIQLAPESVTRHIEFPTLSGISADHINNLFKSESEELYRLRRHRKTLFKEDLIKFVENEIIFGTIEFQKKKGKIRGKLMYNIKGHKIPLYRASSMVSELSSLVIFLKTLLFPGDLLIFEEPESHLHPDSQVKIAKLILILLKNDVNIIITTHSDYFLQQINNYIKISQLPKEKVLRLFDKDLSISKEDVSINLFKYNVVNNETYVKNIALDDFGLTEDIFFEITKELYQESSTIDELINRELENERNNNKT